MSAAVSVRTTRRPVLDLDPDLGSGVRSEDWALARHACRGDLVRVPRGRWALPADAGETQVLAGLLIVSGLLCREVALRDRWMLELLGPGDILQPPIRADRPRLGGEIAVTAAIDTELIALGESFIAAAARWPSLLAAVQRRLEAQREHLAMQGLIAHLPRADHRMLLILHHLSDRWGRVTPDGTIVTLPLTHDVLGQLAAARRSTATLALSQLERAGHITRLDDGGWLLTAAGEQRLEVIARAGTNPRPLGDAVALRQMTTETRMAARAVRAEARLVRRRPHR
jgi:hypothetical protein